MLQPLKSRLRVLSPLEAVREGFLIYKPSEGTAIINAVSPEGFVEFQDTDLADVVMSILERYIPLRKFIPIRLAAQEFDQYKPITILGYDLVEFRGFSILGTRSAGLSRGTRIDTHGNQFLVCKSRRNADSPYYGQIHLDNLEIVGRVSHAWVIDVENIGSFSVGDLHLICDPSGYGIRAYHLAPGDQSTSWGLLKIDYAKIGAVIHGDVVNIRQITIESPPPNSIGFIYSGGQVRVDSIRFRRQGLGGQAMFAGISLTSFGTLEVGSVAVEVDISGPNAAKYQIWVDHVYASARIGRFVANCNVFNYGTAALVYGASEFTAFPGPYRGSVVIEELIMPGYFERHLKFGSGFPGDFCYAVKLPVYKASYRVLDDARNVLEETTPAVKMINLPLQVKQKGTNVAVPEGATSLTITLPVAEPDTNYGVLVTPAWNTNCWVTGKTTTDFTVNFGTPAPTGGSYIDWFVYR